MGGRRCTPWWQSAAWHVLLGGLAAMVLVVLTIAGLVYGLSLVHWPGGERHAGSCAGHGGFERPIYQNGALVEVVCRDGLLLPQ